MKTKTISLLFVLAFSIQAGAICNGIPVGMTEHEADIRANARMQARQQLTLDLARINGIGMAGDRAATCDLVSDLMRTLRGPSCPLSESEKSLEPVRTVLRLSYDFGFSEDVGLDEIAPSDPNGFIYPGIRVVKTDNERVEAFYSELFDAYYESTENTGAWGEYSFEDVQVDVCQALDEFNR